MNEFVKMSAYYKQGGNLRRVDGYYENTEESVEQMQLDIMEESVLEDNYFPKPVLVAITGGKA